jgi:hypothetical protein
MKDSGGFENVITILIVAIWVIVTIYKKVKKMSRVVVPPSPPMETYDFERADTWQNAESLEEVSAEMIAPSPYFTYESPENNYEMSKSFVSEVEKGVIAANVQIEDVEEDNLFHLEYSNEEIYKGIIYSEIFQRRYY